LDALTFQSPIEEAAANAVQRTYDSLIASGCAAAQLADTGQCGGNTFSLFESVRELVETANQLAGVQGLRQFSLNLDQENLGFALRWNAAEEFAAQGSSATEFSNSQLSSLASRVAALRFATRGRGGGASGDSEGGAKRWGGFINGSYGYGSKDDTSDPFELTTGTNGNEVGFDFDGQEMTLGVDYRINDSWVVGALGGYTQRDVDFDSSVSIVDGGIEAEGESLIVFGLWEGERYYLSGSLGGQWMTYEMERRITYPSLNPLIPSTDDTRFSETDSTALTATFGAGYTRSVNAFGFELFAHADYQDITIDGFDEELGSGHELTIGEQTIESLEIAAGLDLHYVFRPRFGVFRPYLRGEYRKELEGDIRTISSFYSSVNEAGAGGTDFSIDTDDPDDDYMLATAGFSVVFPNGLQGYLQYQQVFDLDLYDDRVIGGGVRFEF
jgi:outer membrane autotransporter protein